MQLRYVPIQPFLYLPIYMSEKTLIVLLGPTGVGKTELSLRIAEMLRCPILSSDSRQLYKELKIGTAAPTTEQLNRVKHYFIGTLELKDYYSAACYEEDAIKLLDELFTSHDAVLMTGGSMMYIDAVCNGIDELPIVSDEIRTLMIERYKKEGLDALCEELKRLDPVFYEQVDLKNHKRVIHALEICHMTGRPYSELRTHSRKQRPFRILKIGLIRDREELYDRINHRVDQMISEGLETEARTVYPHRELNSLNTVGYKEMFAYISGEWSLEKAIEKIKRNTRVYSRKQMTWFKRDPQITWFSPEQEYEIMQFIKDHLTGVNKKGA